jgi:uncharacterized membrane protein YfcA
MLRQARLLASGADMNLAAFLNLFSALTSVQFVKLLILGLMAGIMSGMFGIGGGTIIVPAMTYAVGFSMRESIGTSLAALLLPFGIMGVIEYYKKGDVNVGAAILLLLGMFLGSYFGARITMVAPELYIKRGFGVFMMLIGLRYLLAK